MGEQVCALLPLFERMAERKLVNQPAEEFAKETLVDRRRQLMECGCTMEMMSHNAMNEQYMRKFRHVSYTQWLSTTKTQKESVVALAGLGVFVMLFGCLMLRPTRSGCTRLCSYPLWLSVVNYGVRRPRGCRN